MPVIALTGDVEECAFPSRIASEKMLLDQQGLRTGFRCKLGVAILQWTAVREGGLLTVIGFGSHTISRTAKVLAR